MLAACKRAVSALQSHSRRLSVRSSRHSAAPCKRILNDAEPKPSLSRVFSTSRTQVRRLDLSGLSSRGANGKKKRQALSTAAALDGPNSGGTLGSGGLLSEDHQALLSRQRKVLADLLELLVESGADKGDLETVKASLSQLDQLFLICIVGEFNVGKSTFLNALLGQEFLQDGPTPTTEDIWKINFGEGDAAGESVGPDGVRTMRCPVPFLHDCQLVDTPGTNVVINGHRKLTDDFIPQADLILFLTSADRPFSESETAFIKQIQAWSKKIVFVVNKADIFSRKPGDLAKVVEFVRNTAQQLLSIRDPLVFTTSAAETLDNKLGNGSTTAESNQFLKLEQYLFQTLTAQDRIKLKLLSPVGIAEAVIAHRVDATAAAQRIIAKDIGILDSVERDLQGFEEDMLRDFEHQISKIDTILLEMLERADGFLTDKLTITNIPSLAFGGNALRKEFEKQVLQFTTQDIDDHIHGLVDWLISKNDRQAETVFKFVIQHSDTGHGGTGRGPVGDVSVVFDTNRRTMLGRMAAQARDTVRAYSIDEQSASLSQTVQQAIAATTAVEAGALGVGALVSASLLDWTGLAGAGVLALTGFYILPYQRYRIKAELRATVTELRANLREGLLKHLRDEQSSHLERIHDGLRPYSRFVKHQTTTLESQAKKLDELRLQLKHIKTAVNDVCE